MEILKGYERICLYCGKDIPRRWEEYTEYYECECIDAVRVRFIEKQISTLRSSIPSPKYTIEKKNILTKIEE